ncbi:hypothetical protein HanRHA438_Chr15g0698431 [Helianthus annuus]|uniref:Uncharacterized protein n=1 Tax=Helianthus annuus TaxID=4232 RepID=A0A9K3DZD7_HELAN|nr:hypothetical protein HanXRQr2_Chr15g0686241 [Helianthus annuus]KAJ0830690.1 hypothetical protein HanPSC8_Chr15g0658301 [Helianthus annuus]KAJ0844078.1 hypothetical protein HanRHA438_Chr15g0698431 [Helianthus annuus]
MVLRRIFQTGSSNNSTCLLLSVFGSGFSCISVWFGSRFDSCFKFWSVVLVRVSVQPENRSRRRHGHRRRSRR